MVKFPYEFWPLVQISGLTSYLISSALQILWMRPRRRQHLEFGFIRCIQTALNILLVSQELKSSATMMSFPLLL